jgi:hypothetical protein
MLRSYARYNQSIQIEPSLRGVGVGLGFHSNSYGEMMA